MAGISGSKAGTGTGPTVGKPLARMDVVRQRMTPVLPPPLSWMGDVDLEGLLVENWQNSENGKERGG